MSSLAPRSRPVALALALAGAVAGCDKTPPVSPPTEPPPRAPELDLPVDDKGLARMLGVDAADLAPAVSADPPPPAGDLKAEVDAFTDLEACVAARARLDPVLGEAIDAIGYDTLLRDACRVLEATKTRSLEPCGPIVSSSLRDRCALSVAVARGDDGACPMAGPNHDPLCVALARRDARLCDAAARDRRASCRAILGRDPSRCGRDRRCERMVARWKGMLPASEPRPELGTRIVLAVTERPDGGADKLVSLDLSSAVLPATVVRSSDTARVVLGEPGPRPWPSPMLATEPRLSFVLQATPANVKQGRHALPLDAVGFEILAPRVAVLSSEALASPPSIAVDLLGLEVGSPIRFTFEADVGGKDRTFKVRLEVNTFVRDVVVTGQTPRPKASSAD